MSNSPKSTVVNSDFLMVETFFRKNVGSDLLVRLIPCRSLSEDGEWYRCKLRAPVSPTLSSMHFVDYGNAEVNNLDDGAGTMEAVYFGNAKGGLNHGGAGKGPWIMADMENALWGADKVQSNELLVAQSSNILAARNTFGFLRV